MSADHRFDLCVCGFPRWRHPVTEKDRVTLMRSTTGGQPHHFFIEEADVVVSVRGKGGRFVRTDHA